jgi:universal stress protein F
MKPILVALDGSPHAPKVLAAAARLATLGKTRLVLLRAFGMPPDFPLAFLEMTDERLEDILRANAEQDVARLARDLDPALVERVAAAPTPAWKAICEAARECDADMVVIGSHGYGLLDRMLGTTAAKVVNHCDRDVLVVRCH